MKRLPIVALIGQTNAGKSSLLNRLAHRNIAIVAREEGTTRDNVVTTIDDTFVLIDTAGLKDPADDFEESIQDQIADAIDSADLICLTLDSSKYPDFRDKDIAKAALRSRKPVLLLLNKSDLSESLPDAEFRSLGIKPDQTLRTSATTGAGTRDLTATIKSNLHTLGFASSFAGRPQLASARPLGRGSEATDKRRSPVKTGAKDAVQERTTQSPAPLKLALIGRPNVGKSSLFNALGKKQQAIVSSRQGTTRDINRLRINYHQRPIEILDTAGLRRPGKREVGIEKFSAIRTLAAIEEADICALLIDATEPHAKLDQALAGQIINAGKGIIVVVTKLDLLSENRQKAAPSFAGHPQLASEGKRRSPVKTGAKDAVQERTAQLPADISPVDQLLNDLERDFNFLPFAPVLLTSSETGKNVTKLFDLLLEVDEARHTETQTAVLNKILREAVVSHPPAGLKNTHPKPKYIVQTDTCPPWFVIHGREMELMHWSYKRYLERKIREVYPMVGTPIMFSFHNERPRKRRA